MAPANTAPVLVPIPNQDVEEGSTLTFTASATDADAGQTVTYSLVGAPAGASIDPNTGVFSWTPTDDDPTATPADAYTFTVRATDSADPAAYDEQEVTVTVSNVAPTITSVSGPVGPIGISGGSATANISVTFTDPGSGDTHTTSIACGNATSASGPRKSAQRFPRRPRRTAASPPASPPLPARRPPHRRSPRATPR